MSPVERLVRDAARLGVELNERDARRLIHLLEELERWNRSYNLTAIRGRDALLTHHLLDSLSIHGDLRGKIIADVGTGAGFPGLPLAVANPARAFTLIDSNAKKIRFVEHAIRELTLDNVSAVHSRVQALKVSVPFDSVVARAFAPLPEMLTAVAALCGPDTRMMAMKGKWPQRELESLPPGWQRESSRELTVPGLNESRCLVVLRRAVPEKGIEHAH